MRGRGRGTGSAVGNAGERETPRARARGFERATWWEGGGGPDPVEPESLGVVRSTSTTCRRQRRKRHAAFSPRDLGTPALASGGPGLARACPSCTATRARAPITSQRRRTAPRSRLAAHPPPRGRRARAAPRRLVLRVVEQPHACSPGAGGDAAAHVLRVLARSAGAPQAAVARGRLQLAASDSIASNRDLGAPWRPPDRECGASPPAGGTCSRSSSSALERPVGGAPTGRVLHRADARRLPPFDHEERGKLVEGLADGLLVHSVFINLTAHW